VLEAISCCERQRCQPVSPEHSCLIWQLPALALFGSAVMSDLSPKCVSERTCADHSEFMGSRPSWPAAKDPIHAVR
jgi:hypothetical protein